MTSDPMDISIQSDTNNRMLQRREIGFVAVQEAGTPRRDELKKEICKKLSLDPDSTILVEVNQEFGMRRSAGIVHSYKSKEQLMKAEPKYLTERLAKSGKKEGSKEAGPAAGQPKEEAPKKEGKQEGGAKSEEAPPEGKKE